MMNDVDLRKLAEIQSQVRIFLTMYLTKNEPLDTLEKRIDLTRKLLQNSEEADTFTENLKQVRDFLEKNPIITKGICLIVCHPLDYFRAIPLTFLAVSES